MANPRTSTTTSGKKAAAPKKARRKAAAPISAKKAASPKAPAKKTAPPRARLDTKSAVTAEERHAMIAVAAYLRAENRGFVGGDPASDWLAAEAEIDQILSRT